MKTFLTAGTGRQAYKLQKYEHFLLHIYTTDRKYIPQYIDDKF